MPVDYHKWDHIEVSDDEDDTHPNVDTASLYRWRHQARLDRMAEVKREKEQLQDSMSEYERKVNDIKHKLTGINLTDNDKERLNTELVELEKQELEYRQKEEELSKKERLQPLNVDTIGHEGFSKSRINKIIEGKKPEEVDEETRAQDLKNFIVKNESILKKFSMLSKLDDSKQFLLDNPQLCCDETANHLVLQCLDYEIEEKHDLMEHVAHQCIVMQYLLELAGQLKVNPKAPQLISSFFSKLKQADKMYHDAFADELRAFKERIQRRAKEKLEEAMREAEEEERKQRLGPGGLDPVEVFESLPKAMQECFEKQDIGSLQQVATTMAPAEFQLHLKRCVDSGLWVPEGGGADKAVGGDQGVEQDVTPTSASAAGPTSTSEETSMRHRKPPASAE